MRKLESDLIYQTFLQETVTEIEGLIPPKSIYAGYSDAKKLLGEPPADYSKVHFYYPQEKIKEVKDRFPPNKKQATNIFVLNLPPVIANYG